MHLDVKEFGAAGNSVTDDTSAIQAACNSATQAMGFWNKRQVVPQIAAAPVVYFPAGVYKISAPISIESYTSMLGEHAILQPENGSIDILTSRQFYEMSFGA
jgi:polygalacturonase